MHICVYIKLNEGESKPEYQIKMKPSLFSVNYVTRGFPINIHKGIVRCKVMKTSCAMWHFL